jgi:ubiquitin carboxyl-terminal hydrolase 7
MLVSGSYQGTLSDILYYEHLEISLIELETKKELKVSWRDNAEVKKTHNLLMPKEATIADVISQIQLAEQTTSKLRIFEIWNNKIYKIFKQEDLISQITDNTALFAEVMP